jgi:CubicO group peptidase (beta-lactamase class C family)
MCLAVTQASVIERFKDKPLEFAPGEKFKYSNSGYYLLGIIIERTSGKTYADFLQENIFAPLGMKQTGYDDARRVIKNRASGYARQGSSIVNAAYTNTSIPFSAGALYSTTEDMLRWDQSLFTEKLVKRKSLEEMFAPFKEGYGYGWDTEKMLDRQMINHSGAISGFSSTINRFADDRVTVIVLGNTQYVPSARLADALSAIVFGAPYKIPAERQAITVATQILDKYIGQYQLAPNFIITITKEDGKLMGQPTGQPKSELFAESETKFFLKTVDAQVTFVKDAEGNVTNLILHQNGRNAPAKKIK